MGSLCQREKAVHRLHAHKMCVCKCLYLCYCDGVLYIYASLTGVGVDELSINDAQFVGFLLLAPLFAQLDIVIHACLLQNIPFISS